MKYSGNLHNHLLILVISVSVAFTACEIFTRLFLSKETDTDYLSEKLRNISIRLVVRPSSNPSIYYEMRPNLNIRYFNSIVRTDSAGRRIPVNAETENPNADIKIDVVGDSTSFGWKIDYEATYPAVLAELLESTYKKSVLLRNYSVPGYNTEQEYEIIKSRIIPDPPDLLIIHYDHNDAEPTAFFQRADFLLPTYGDNILHSAFIKYLIRRYRIHENMKRTEFNIKHHRNIRGYLVDGPFFEKHIITFEKIADLVKNTHIPTIIVIYSAEVTYDPDYMSNSFYTQLCRRKERLFSKMGFYVLDLYPHFQKYLKEHNEHDLRNWWISSKPPIDSHPNVLEHRFIGETLFRFIAEHRKLRNIFVQCQPLSVHTGG